jgi:hypothetical protein
VRLVHQTFLVLLVAALVTVAAMAGLFALNVDHRDVAWIRIWPVRSVDRPDNGDFLQARYTRIAWAALALILLTGALAPLVVQRVAAR